VFARLVVDWRFSNGLAQPASGVPASSRERTLCSRDAAGGRPRRQAQADVVTQVMLAKIARVFAILIIPAAIGISLHTAVRILHRRIVFWRKPDHKIES